MFEAILTGLESELETIKKVLDTHDLARELVFKIASADSADSEGVPALRKAAPKKTDWQVYDHCAAFTRLYAVYEQFITDMVSEVLITLPALYQVYNDLPKELRIQHRLGIGQILQKLGENSPFSDLTENEIVPNFATALSREVGYRLLANAFFLDANNYRRQLIVRIVGYLGCGDCWPWVSQHRLMRNFLAQNCDETASPESQLNTLIVTL